MQVAILADIHGNLPALEAVMEDIQRAAPDYVVAAGDLALRGAFPRETVEMIFDRCDMVLMGNTDSYIAGNYLGGAYRDREHWKTDLLQWTREQLGAELVKKLGELPFSARYTPRRGQDLFICHANPRNLEDSLDPTLDEAGLRRFFGNLDAAACAFGHLHFPYRRRLGRMLLSDVASAGIPRDGDVRPAYGIFTFTPKGWRVQIRRVRYQVRKATQALTAKHVPGGPLLVHKLVEARYRHHAQLMEAARRHSGLPPLPVLRPPPGITHVDHGAVAAALLLGNEAPKVTAAQTNDADHDDSVPDAQPISEEGIAEAERAFTAEDDGLSEGEENRSTVLSEDAAEPETSRLHAGPVDPDSELLKKV